MVSPQAGPGFPRLTLLVPVGAEYRAVRQGVRRGADPAWPVVGMPLGKRQFPRWWAEHRQKLENQPAVLLGLAGGLQADLTPGSGVIWTDCTDSDTGSTRPCDPEITQWLSERLGLPTLRGLTVPQVVTQPQEKQQLGQKFHCAVVDMEAYPLLCALPRLGILRVVSDAMHQPLPDLGAAVDEMTGQLDPGRLAWVMFQRPKAAISLIQGALTGLARLTALAQELTANSEKNYNKI